MLKSLLFILVFGITLVISTDIDGVVVSPQDAPSNWVVNTKVRVDGNKYFGFMRSDGSFVVSNVPPGSYLIEFTNPTYLFQVSLQEFLIRSV